MDTPVKKQRIRIDSKGRVLHFELTTGRYVHGLTDLYKRWRKPLIQWLRLRAGGKLKFADLDDIVQEVFLRVMRYSGADLIDNAQGYLFRTADNVVNEWTERARYRKDHLDLDDPELDYLSQMIEEVDPEEIARDIDETNKIWEAIQQLPTRQRRILLRHIRDGRTYKQIAAERGITYRVILRELTRAYAHLRVIMKRSDFDGY